MENSSSVVALLCGNRPEFVQVRTSQAADMAIAEATSLQVKLAIGGDIPNFENYAKYLTQPLRETTRISDEN